MGAGYDHGGEVLAFVGFSDSCDGDHAVHKGTRDYRVNLTDLALEQTFLYRKEAASETLCVSYNSIKTSVTDSI